MSDTPEQSIVFRVIRGRVVPVRVGHPADQNVVKKKAGYNYGKAAAGIGGGVAVTAGAGLVAGESVRQASRLRAESTHKFTKLYASKIAAHGPGTTWSYSKLGRGSAFKATLQNRLIGQKLFVNRHKILLGGAAAGLGLMTWGFKQAQKPKRGRPKSFKTVEAGALGTAAVALAGALYYRRLGRKNLFEIASAVSKIRAGQPTGTKFAIPTGAGKFLRLRTKLGTARRTGHSYRDFFTGWK